MMNSRSARRASLTISLYLCAVLILIANILGNSTPHVFSSDGQDLKPFFESIIPDEAMEEARLQSPAGIAIDQEGNIIVSDQGTDQIHKFSANGSLMASFGTSCNLATRDGCIDIDGPGPLISGDGQFSSPSGVAIDSDGNILVIDQGNRRIQKLSSDGQFIVAYNDSSFSGPKFGKINDIAVDSTDNMYVTDMGGLRVFKISPNGTLLEEFSGNHSNNSAIPIGVAVDSHDDVYVTFGDNYHVEKFSANGTFLMSFGSPGACRGEFGASYGIASDNDDMLYVVDQTRHRVQIFSSSGAYIGMFGLQGNDAGPFLYYPVDIAIDSERNLIFVTDNRNGRIVVWNSATVGQDQSRLDLETEIFTSIGNSSFTTIDAQSSNIYPICGQIIPDESMMRIEFDILEPDQDGMLTLTLPKEYIDGITSIETNRGENLTYNQISESATKVKLGFSIPSDANALEIRAARVMPEFSQLTAVALLSVVLTIVIMISKRHWNTHSA